MKIISIFFIFLCLSSSAKAYDDSLYMYFDLEGMLPGYEIPIKIMFQGKFNDEIANFVSNIAIPANVSSCTLMWHTTPNTGTTYIATVYSMDPEMLGVSLDIPSKGTVDDHEKKFHIFFTCHETGEFTMRLRLQFFNRDYTQEYEGFDIYPKHTCDKIDYDPCIYYHDSVKVGEKKNAYTFSSINMQPSEVQLYERFKEAYESLVQDSVVLLIQGATPEVREDMRMLVKETYKYRIPYPHIRGEVQSAPLYVMSKNPIYTCNYIEFDKSHEYGAVIAGIAMSEHRIVFLINAILPEVYILPEFNDVVDKLAEEVEKAVSDFLKEHKNYYVDGYFFGDVNFETDIQTTFLSKMNGTIGEMLGKNYPGSDLSLAYNKKTANTTATFKIKKINPNKNYTGDDANVVGAVQYGALQTRVSWGYEPKFDDETSDSANNYFNLICSLLIIFSLLIIM